MPGKVLWVALPLLLLAVGLIGVRLAGRWPRRASLNALTSLFLLGYLLATAGLGLFWVANQQLPVFDWHYLFGYATLLLVAVHLVFNLRLVLAWLKKRPGPAATPARGWPLGAALAAIGLALAFWLGLRHGGGEVLVVRPTGAAVTGEAAVEAYHEMSSTSRAGVLVRAPQVDWGPPPPPFKRDDPGRAFRALPRPWETAAVAASGAPDEATLATILFHAAGITEVRGGLALRASPSSGALFSSELYLATCVVPGMPGRLWHYDPERHGLVDYGEIPTGCAPWAPEAASAPAQVIVSAIFRRTGVKYRDRTYRYVAADAGHLLENLRLAGLATGLRVEPLPRFDEGRAAAALGLPRDEEDVIAVLSADRDAGRGEARWAAAPADEDRPLGATAWVQRVTSQVATEARPWLPSDVLRLIRERRSVRTFAAEPLPGEALREALDAVTRPAPRLSDAVRVNVVVNRATGHEPGAWRLERGELRLVRPGALGEATASAALAQDVIRDAAAVVVLSIDRQATFARDGARGYRHAYLEAGMLGERLYLEAGARGWGACSVGAFFDREMAEVVGLDPAREWVVHLVALGPR